MTRYGSGGSREYRHLTFREKQDLYELQRERQGMVFCARLRGSTLSWRVPDGSKGMAQSDARLVPLWRVGLSGMTLEPGRQARKLLQKSRLEIIRPQKPGQWYLGGGEQGVSAINIQEEESTDREDFLIVLVFFRQTRKRLQSSSSMVICFCKICKSKLFSLQIVNTAGSIM